MKKLMVIAAVAMAVLASNAATMKWGAGANKVEGQTVTSGLASLYVIDAAAYAAIETATTGLDAAGFSKYIYDNYSTQTATATATGVSKGSFSTLTDPGTYAAGDTAYAVLIYTTTVDDKDYYIANAGQWNFATDTAKTLGNMALKVGGSGDSLSWAQASAVPEPTSGLLLLLGMAGLALKRKRA